MSVCTVYTYTRVCGGCVFTYVRMESFIKLMRTCGRTYVHVRRASVSLACVNALLIYMHLCACAMGRAARHNASHSERRRRSARAAGRQRDRQLFPPHISVQRRHQSLAEMSVLQAGDRPLNVSPSQVNRESQPALQRQGERGRETWRHRELDDDERTKHGNSDWGYTIERGRETVRRSYGGERVIASNGEIAGQNNNGIREQNVGFCCFWQDWVAFSLSVCVSVVAAGCQVTLDQRWREAFSKRSNKEEAERKARQTMQECSRLCTRPNADTHLQRRI